MKKLLMIMLVGLFGLSVMAQKAEKDAKENIKIPAAVKAAFQKDYPSVKKANWVAEKKDFEAEFKLNGVTTSANYDKTGKKLEEETTIKANDLPKAALDYVAKNFPKHKITEAAKTIYNKNKVTYEAEVTLKDMVHELKFDRNGKLLTKGKAD
jgi:hypothetical protein